jgi:integrase
MANGSGQQVNHIQQEIKTFLESDALKGMSEREVLAQLSGALLARCEELDPVIDSCIDKNKVIQEKTFIFPPRDNAFIYRHKGLNWYYAERSGEDRSGPYMNGVSLRVGTDKKSAIAKAEDWYINKERVKKAGVLRKSINTAELIRRYMAHQQQRITVATKKGLTQESFDAKFQKLTYWQNFIIEKGFETTPVYKIPPSTAEFFGLWINNLPKKAYRGRERSIETINACIGAAQALYHWATLKDRAYVEKGHFPDFKRLDDVARDARDERDILTKEEWEQLKDHLSKQVTDKSLKEIDRAKNAQTYWYFKLAYETGMRLKEINNLRWNQVTAPRHEKGIAKDVFRSIYIPLTKTGRKRTIVSEVAYIFNAIHKLYKKRGIDIDRQSDTRVFFKLYTHRHDIDSWVTEKAMVDRLDINMKEIGLYEKLQRENPPRRITPNSSRHYAATYLIVDDGWSYERVALHLGHDAAMTEKRYSKVTNEMIAAKSVRTKGIAAVENTEFIDRKTGRAYPEEKQEVFREEVTRLALEKPDAFELKVQNGRIKVEDKRPDGVTEHDWAMMNDFGDPEWDRSQTRLKNADN